MNNPGMNFRHDDGAPRPSRMIWVWIALAGAMLLLVAAGSVITYQIVTHKSLPAITAEDKSQKTKEVVSAYSGDATSDAGIDPVDLRQTMLDFGKALRANNQKDLEDSFDCERLIDEVERQPSLPKMSSNDRASFLTGVKRGLGSNSAQSPFASVKKIDISLVKKLDTPKDALVYVKLRDEGVTARLRVWVHRDRKWRIYDFEDLDGGIRVSTTLGQAMAYATSSNLAALQNDFGALRTGIQLITQKRFDEADAELAKIPPGRLSNELEGLRLTMVGATRLSQGRFDESLKLFDEAETKNPDIPIIYFLRSSVYVQQQQFEKAREAAQKHIDLVGISSLTMANLGVALNGLHRPEEAIAAFQSGLAEDPASLDCLIGLLKFLPESKRSEMAALVANFPLTQEQYRIVVSELRGPDHLLTKQMVVDAYRKQNGDSIETEYYVGLQHFSEKDFAAAAVIFKKYLATPDDYYRQSVRDSYLESMVELNTPMEGYEGLGKSDEAFLYLVGRLQYRDVKAFRSIVEAHHKNNPSSALVAFYLAKLDLGEKNFAAAEEHFKFAQDRNTDKEWTKVILMARANALCQNGRMVWAYNNVMGGKEGFDHIARQGVAKHDLTGLQSLMAVHEKKFPDDPHLRLWESEVKFQTANYSGAVKLLQTYREAAHQTDRPYYAFEDRLIRSLLRQGKIDEAKAELLSSAGKGPVDEFYKLLIFARAGDPAAPTLMKKILDSDYDIDDIISDDDLGPIIRNDAKFADIRKQYADAFSPPATSHDAKPSSRP